MTLKLEQYLHCLVDRPLTAIASAQLEALMLADSSSSAFGVTDETVGEVVQQRSQQLRELYPTLSEFCRHTLGWQQIPLTLIWNLWLPLVQQMIAAQQKLDRPLVQGILGGQGTGKTTLAAILTLILNQLGYGVVRLSLDDLYKTYADRLQLQQTDPRWRWRGPPGTHDIDLGLSVLQQLRAAPNQPVLLPRFDKSLWGGAGDRAKPEWNVGAAVVLFEGWFVGIRSIDPQVFDTAPPPILTAADRTFARDVNACLQAYQPLWQQLDRLIVLLPTNYRLSQQWRREAEQQMRASGRPGMSDAEVDEFVLYFWRSLHPQLFIPALLRHPKAVDLVIEINSDHTPEKIYHPGSAG
jgi:D-glycerate 3-kinase